MSTSWQQELAQSITDPAALLQRLQLPSDLFSRQAATDFQCRVTESYLGRMEVGNPHDPLLQQVLPIAEELQQVAGFILDPLEEQHCAPVSGLLHKYQGRALLVTTGACAIHCRYCCRRHYPYTQSNPLREHWQEVMDYLRADTSIEEVIFSGGDPLVLPDSRLANLVEQLETIPHLQTLRIHTRLPIMLPQRVDTALCDWMKRTRLGVVMVIHANHAQELDTEVLASLKRLRDADVWLLNQSVLLHGINDSVDDLVGLSKRLGQAQVQPYYLHLLDRIAGAAHFEVLESVAKDLYAEMHAVLPGYLLPKLVREVSGEAGKTLVFV